jgi:hypothetical protein
VTHIPSQAPFSPANFTATCITTTQPHHHATTCQLRDLLLTEESIPCFGLQPEFVQLKARLFSAESLQVRIRELLPSKRRRGHHSGDEAAPKIPLARLEELQREVKATGVDFSEARALEDLATKINTWRVGAEAAVKNTPDLKQLREMIASGESLPVGFPALLTQLQAKLKQAEVWVERVRSAVPRQNRTRNKADMEKVEFGTMKNLLNEVNTPVHSRTLTYPPVRSRTPLISTHSGVCSHTKHTMLAYSHDSHHAPLRTGDHDERRHEGAERDGAGGRDGGGLD